ncbi:MAG: CDP-alcohol phosphatidyltransferase family protein [Nitrospinota bacterium]
MVFTAVPHLTLATKVTALRILLVPLFVLLLVYGQRMLALLLFCATGLLDGVDGFIARRRGEKTKLGALLDPLADKMLLMTSFVALTLLGVIPAWLTIVVVSRDLLIGLGFMIIFFLSGYPEPRPSMLGKLTTVAQILTIFFALVVHALDALSRALEAMGWAAAALTVASGLHYLHRGGRMLAGGPAEGGGGE